MTGDTRSYSRYILVVLCVSVVFTTIVLIALNAWLTQNQTETAGLIPGIYTEENLEQAYRQGFTAARETLRERGLLNLPPEIRELYGTVVSKHEGYLILKQNSLDTDPVVDDVPDERKILISTSTRLYSPVLMSPEEFIKEIQRFQSSDSLDQAPPSGIKKSFIALDNIPVGARLMVYADEDVRLKFEIPAREILISTSLSQAQ